MEPRNIKLTEVSLLSDGIIGLGFMHKDPLCTCDEPPFRGFCTVHDTRKPDCLQRKKHVHGITDMKELARTIGDLHYKTLFELIKHLAIKLSEDSSKDMAGDRTKLALHLYEAAMMTAEAAISLRNVWKVSESRMYKPSPLLAISKAVQNYMDAYNTARMSR